MSKIQKFTKPAILFLCVVIIGFSFSKIRIDRDKLDYYEHLQDTVVTIDGTDMTFEDLAFYILYEENLIENQAMIYNPDSTKDYWNLHLNDGFIETQARDAVIGMAIHDNLFYQMAMADGMDELTEDDEVQIQYAITDFWEDLLDVQIQKCSISEAVINEQIKKAAIAEKYQNHIALRDGPSIAAYKFDGYYYSQILADHDIVINEKLWDRFVLGDITLEHGKVNYINGLSDEEKKKSKE